MFVILRQREFCLLWLAGLISFIGDFALIVALPLHVYRLTGSTLTTAAAFAASLLPGVLVGSLAGVFVDRWDRKLTMVGADVSRAVLLPILLLAPDRMDLLLAVAAIQGTIGLFFAPAAAALLPALVDKERLVAANALTALNFNFGMLIGPALGAFLYAKVGISGVALVDAASYLCSALLIAKIAVRSGTVRRVISNANGSPWKRIGSDWREGLRLVRRDQALFVLFAASSINAVAHGVFLTLGLAPFVLDVLGGSPAQVGWLGAAQAGGGLIAGIAIARLGHRLAKRWLFGGGMVGLGLADLGAFNARVFAAQGTPAVVVAMGWMVVAGFPVVALGAGRQALVQTLTAHQYHGRVFGALSTFQGAGTIIGLGVGGVLGNIAGIVPVLSASAALRVLSGIAALWLLPRQEPMPECQEVAA